MNTDNSLIDFLSKWNNRVRQAEINAHKILALHEKSKSRIILLEDLLKKIDFLPIDIKGYFIEAISCLENNFKRSAIVLSWAGFFYILTDNLYNYGESAIRTIRPKWSFSTIEELRETQPEAQILDALHAAKLINKNDTKIFQGQLTTRNKCAHPTLYQPSLNSAIGFVDDIIQQTIKYI